MKQFISILAIMTSLLCSAVTAQVEIEWVFITHAGNAADPTTGYGSVDHEYRIGKYEITNAQYAEFLNSVALSDPYDLYHASMGSNSRGGILRAGVEGKYQYEVKEDMANKPVNFVNWYDAARMANWITNGQGLGETENGVYIFDGVTSVSTIVRDVANPSQVFLPTEDEWYKAAYYQEAASGRGADGYWLYATQSNTTPTIAAATSTGDIANPGLGVVNYSRGVDWNGENGNVSTVGSAENTSYYGAFDMNGNVEEWSETINTFRGLRSVRGADYASGEAQLRSTFRNTYGPTFVSPELGFRLASMVPEQSCRVDLNGDGLLNFFDVSVFLIAFTDQDTNADFNQDGEYNFFDVSMFLVEFGQGCGE